MAGLRTRVARLRERGLSTQIYLVALAIALIGPGLLFTAILLGRYAALERARFEQDARETVRGIALTVDRDTAGLISVLQTLATSPRLRRAEEAASFEDQARAVTEATQLMLSLRRPDGTQLVNTALPRGAPLPQGAQPYDAEVLATRAPLVTGVQPGPPGRPPSYAVAVPVVIDGEAAFVLSATAPVERLHQILLRDLAEGWITALVDRNGLLLARSRDHAALVGEPMLEALRGREAGTPGLWEGLDRQHRPVLFVETRTRITGWTASASIPRALVEASLRRWMAAFGGFGLLALAVSSLLAVRLWSRVAEPLRLLAAAGGALGRGQPVPRVSTPIREIRQVADALADASETLRQRIAERDRALEEQSRGLVALRESEARFRHMADSAPALIWMTDEAGETTFVNMHYEYLFGRPAATLVGRRWREVVHPDDVAGFEAAFAAAFAARRPLRVETRVIDGSGAVRWLLCEGVPRLDDRHRFLGYTGCNVDITEAKLAEAALRESEERLRLALAAGQLGTWEIDLATGQNRLSARSAEIVGLPPLPGGWMGAVHPADRPALDAALAALIAGEAEYRSEFRVRPVDGVLRWVSAEAVVQRDAGGAPRRVIGIHQDVTERKRAEDHLRLLIHELNHRVKNTLATVQSIAMQSLRRLRGREAEGARDAFVARLIALARAHDVLTRESWEGAELAEVVAGAVAPLEGPRGRRPRFSVAGPPLRLPPRMALSIAMALHELATNAVKYGALSAVDGQVSIAWSVEAGRLTLRWQESGGPSVTPPERTGFGSRLIGQSLARDLAGEVSLDYPPAGVICTIVAPLDEAEEAPAGEASGPQRREHRAQRVG
ncbi:signal transduction histidine kinase [Methylobacterium sp. 4-46]|uniref:sensor histidine kinase n=1 Tax=unclassified Methylobacterium TaxID=2615210 RepID=UPI000152C7F0|nr:MULTISPECIES: sensor histidine kinase [Methylobacterium]ACA16170.1 signal transduction histidine kinase [Methylobacterium sp. 4-46]WFT81879.1 PAS domain S-box protein [Methylobacterium nodulans]